MLLNIESDIGDIEWFYWPHCPADYRHLCGKCVMKSAYIADTAKVSEKLLPTLDKPTSSSI